MARTKVELGVAAWGVLTKAAKGREIITYEELAKRLGYEDGGATAMRHALDPVQAYCIRRQYRRLTSIVVSKGTGKPGDGFIYESDADLAETQARVFDFAWETVKRPTTADLQLALAAKPKDVNAALEAPSSPSPGLDVDEPEPAVLLGTNYYMVRAMEQKEPYYDFFFEKDVVAIGWSRVNVAAIADPYEAAERAMREYKETDHPPARSKKVATIVLFKGLRKGDRIVVPYGKTLVLAVATGVTKHEGDERALELALGNQHLVEYVTDPDGTIKEIPTSDFPVDLIEKMGKRARGKTMVVLNDFADVIERAFQPPRSRRAPNIVLSDNEIPPEESEALLAELARRVAAGNFHVPDRYALAKIREVSAEFRRLVLANFDHRCAVCGLAEPRLLDAAHLRGWSTDPEHRANPLNGIALCPTHHRAFDRGFLKINGSGLITVADAVLLSTDAELKQQIVRFHQKRVRNPVRPVDFQADES